MKVTDFGIARAETSEPLTKTGAVLGTATYFSPEQAQGFALDGRSDVYALGVVLYEMLTGVAPFTASSPVSVAYKHVREAPAPPSSIVPRHPRRRWTTSCSPRWRRTSSCGTRRRQDLRADLLRFERGRPVVGADDRDRWPPPRSRVAAPVMPAAVATAPRSRGATQAQPVGTGHRHRHRARAARRLDRVPPRQLRLRRRGHGHSHAQRPERRRLQPTARPKPGSRPRDSPWRVRTSTTPSRYPTWSWVRTPRAVARSRRAGSSRSR